MFCATLFFFFSLSFLSLQHSEDKAKEKQKDESPTASKTQKSKASKKLGAGDDKNFKPIKGLFQLNHRIQINTVLPESVLQSIISPVNNQPVISLSYIK